MKNIFIINAGQAFTHSGGEFQNTLTKWTTETLKELGFDLRVTSIAKGYDPNQEIENFKWQTL